MLAQLDVQGSELRVLQGAPAALEAAEVVLLELPLVAYNAGAPMWLRTHLKLERAGFRLYDLPELHRDRNGTLIQVDALFVRTASSLWAPEVTGYPRPRR